MKLNTIKLYNGGTLSLGTTERVKVCVEYFTESASSLTDFNRRKFIVQNVWDSGRYFLEKNEVKKPNGWYIKI